MHGGKNRPCIFRIFDDNMQITSKKTPGRERIDCTPVVLVHFAVEGKIVNHFTEKEFTHVQKGRKYRMCRAKNP